MATMAVGYGDVTRSLNEAARTIHESRTLEETLDAVVETVILSLPEFTHAGVSVIQRGGKIETLSGTDPFVWELDALQEEHREGPGFDAIQRNPVVVVERAGFDPRWPTYIASAVARGLRSQLSLRLYNDKGTLGCLTLYSTMVDTIDRDWLPMAELFATHASIAFGRARSEDNLSQAVATRKVIGQAIGIISERYQIPEERAFQFLVRASQDSNIKLRAVAQEVVDTTNERYSKPPVP